MSMASALNETPQELTISTGEYRCGISTLGATLSWLTYAARPLVPAYDPLTTPPMFAGTVLAPWPNRVADGCYIDQGKQQQLELNEPERNNAIHGLVHDQLWTCVEQSQAAVTLRLDAEPRTGWPWTMTYQITWSLDPETGLNCGFTVQNQSDTRCPLAIGFHPYVMAQGEPLDECVLTVGLDSYLPLDSTRNLPAGPLTSTEKLGLPSGFASGLPLKGIFFDHCFTSSTNNCTYQATLAHPATGHKVVVRCAAPATWLQIFTADPEHGCELPGYGRVIAIEPMTAPPDALRSGTDLIYLEPGHSQDLHWSIGAQ